MERNKNPPLLFLLLALLHVCAAEAENCPSVPDDIPADISCYTDYNRVITCVWNSSHAPDHPDNVCTVHGKRHTNYNSSCNLTPIDASTPTMKKCSMIFQRESRFQTFHELSIDLSCKPVELSFTFPFKPACHIKPNPPPRPDINSTTVSWSSQVPRNMRISDYGSQLQWKHEDQSWSDPSVHKTTQDTQCKSYCTAELDRWTDLLIQGQRYEARVRVKAIAARSKSTWSDWSPAASWVSPIGRTKPQPSDLTGGVSGIVVGAAAFAVLLVVVHFKADKTTWVYMVKRIRGPPLPDPANSFLKDVNFQNWLSPYLTNEYVNSFFKPVEIVSVEVTSAVDAVAPCGSEAALLEKMRSESSHGSTSSNFSNPSYSQLCPLPPPPPPPPISSLTVGNLAPCAADTPYGPVGCQGEVKDPEEDSCEERGKEVEIGLLLSKGSDSSEPMLVISDYEKAERLQVERVRLQSLDSGVCSGEEAGQESLEADRTNATDRRDEGLEGAEEREVGKAKEVDFQKLFGGSAGLFGEGSIQLCSSYEKVQMLQGDSPELPSLDSGISSGGEEQGSQEESLEDIEMSTESTSLLFPPPPSNVLACSPAFSGPGSSPALRPLPSHLRERIALMSANRFVEPSGDGYMPG